MKSDALLQARTAGTANSDSAFSHLQVTDYHAKYPDQLKANAVQICKTKGVSSFKTV